MRKQKATVWGKKVDLTISIAPAGTPTETLPVATKEQEDAEIHCELELFLQDKDDSFYGHVMFVLVIDRVVKEITVMG